MAQNLIASDLVPIFENWNHLLDIGDEDLLLVNIDSIIDCLNKDLLLDLGENFPEVVEFIRKNFPHLNNC